MKPNELILRCYADKREGSWQAFCLDLNLAAQGETYEQTRQKLDAMINSYVSDALEGEDREYADQLIPRRAPLRFWVRYYYYWALSKGRRLPGQMHHLFNEILPVRPAGPCRHNA